MARTRPKPKRYQRKLASRKPCVHGESGVELRPHQIILRPLVTEKGTHQSTRYNSYTFMVSPLAQGRGIGKAMGLACLAEAREAGFLAMQFNFVVSTNTAAVALWQQLGFAIVGTLPQAFSHKTLGLVDACVMYRRIDQP